MPAHGSSVRSAMTSPYPARRRRRPGIGVPSETLHARASTDRRAKKQAALSADQPKPFATQGYPSFERPPSDLGEGLPSRSITPSPVEAEASAGDALLRPSRRGVPIAIRRPLGVAPAALRTALLFSPRASVPSGRRLLVLPQISWRFAPEWLSVGRSFRSPPVHVPLGSLR